MFQVSNQHLVGLVNLRHGFLAFSRTISILREVGMVLHSQLVVGSLQLADGGIGREAQQVVVRL